jgi:hypothetical protein
VPLRKDSDITQIFSTILRENGDPNTSLADINQESRSIEVETTLGVKLIWTRAGYRRQCVASKLLDNARRCFFFGKIVAKDKLGFSQPTRNGLDFAIDYCKLDKMWGYS